MLEVFCIASGPSLTREDVERVRLWRARSECRSVIVINTSFKLAPWADILYAMDRTWWNIYGNEVNAIKFAGQRVSVMKCDPKYDVTEIPRQQFDHFANSGAGAIAYSVMRGARLVYLLGYDCKRTPSKSHWHGDHPRPLTNIASIHRWPQFFQRLARHASMKGTKVINVSRDTALTMFKRESADDVLPPLLVEVAA